MPRRLAIGLALVAVFALPASAHAVLSGENGRIVYISGPAFGPTKLFLRSVTSSTGAGTKTGPLNTGLNDQHRHPTWSPDRTKIAFAEGAGGVFDIYVFDLTVPPAAGTNPQNITNTPAISEDRPAWSPDGTRIAYEDATDIFVRNLVFPFGTINMTSNITPKAWKAAWSPDSQTLYYGVGDITQPPNGNNNDVKLFHQAANAPLGGTEFLHVSGAHVFQPSISPDGTKMCFTFSDQPGNSTHAQVLVVPVSAPGSPPLVLTNSGVGDYNCTWSPDGFEIAYTEDFAGNGEVLMEEADGSGVFAPNLSDTPMAFDGNPDWAPDARPVCPDTTVTTNRNTPITFQVNCEDTGPAYEQSEVREFNKTSPLNGTLTQEFAGDPFTYTPNQGFVGTDSFVVQSFDEFGFGADTGTVMITVRNPGGGGGGGGGGGATAKCAGKTATIVGTTGADVLRGTGRRDVIASLGGNDRIRGGRGNDLICAGSGRDRVAAGSGGDRVLGGSGPDRLSGNSGNDRLSGGTGRDTLIGGSGRDRLNGGASRDICRGGLGRDAGSRCERRSSIP